MKSSIDLYSIKTSLSAFFGRFHSIIFFLFLAAALGTAIVIVLSILELSSRNDAANVQPVSSEFDETTINQLNGLSSDDNRGLSFPNGRINPFAE